MTYSINAQTSPRLVQTSFRKQQAAWAIRRKLLVKQALYCTIKNFMTTTTFFILLEISSSLEIGDRVIVKSATGSQTRGQTGYLRFHGETEFASGILLTKNDGSVDGKF